MSSKNTICLWYDGDAFDAANFYAETFPDSAVGTVYRAPSDYPDGRQGDVLTVEFTEAGIPWELNEQWWKEGKGQDRDRMYAQMTTHVIRRHRPNVAVLHLVELDHVEHAKGPQSPEAYAALKFEDERVAEVWAELSRRGDVVGAHDLWIGATALAYGFGVATGDIGDFRRIPGLRVLTPAA